MKNNCISSFKEFITEDVLLEDRIETLKSLHPTISTSHDDYADQIQSDKIIDHFANHDPTPNKQYTQWMVNQYKKKNFRQEDLPRVKEALTGFHQHKAKLEKKDINQYKKLSDVEDATEPHLGTVSKKQEKAQIKHEGAELIHDSGGVTVHQLNTKEAACHYGAGTKWCTAAKKNNRFDYYNTAGPLHVIQHAGRKYQFHNHSGQFMDEKDNQVPHEGTHPDIPKELAKSDHPEIVTHNILNYNPHLSSKHIYFGLNHDDTRVSSDAILHPNATSEHVSHAMKDKRWALRYDALDSYGANAEHFKLGLKDTSEMVRRKAKDKMEKEELKIGLQRMQKR